MAVQKLCDLVSVIGGGMHFVLSYFCCGLLFSRRGQKTEQRGRALRQRCDPL
jgi:hypothetical protein